MIVLITLMNGDTFDVDTVLRIPRFNSMISDFCNRIRGIKRQARNVWNKFIINKRYGEAFRAMLLLQTCPQTALSGAHCGPTAEIIMSIQKHFFLLSAR